MRLPAEYAGNLSPTNRYELNVSGATDWDTVRRHPKHASLSAHACFHALTPQKFAPELSVGGVWKLTIAHDIQNLPPQANEVTS